MSSLFDVEYFQRHVADAAEFVTREEHSSGRLDSEETRTVQPRSSGE